MSGMQENKNSYWRNFDVNGFNENLEIFQFYGVPLIYNM